MDPVLESQEALQVASHFDPERPEGSDFNSLATNISNNPLVFKSISFMRFRHNVIELLGRRRVCSFSGFPFSGQMAGRSAFAWLKVDLKETAICIEVNTFWVSRQTHQDHFDSRDTFFQFELRSTAASSWNVFRGSASPTEAWRDVQQRNGPTDPATLAASSKSSTATAGASCLIPAVSSLRAAESGSTCALVDNLHWDTK
jgi:hypothetical protein